MKSLIDSLLCSSRGKNNDIRVVPGNPHQARPRKNLYFYWSVQALKDFPDNIRRYPG